MGQGSARQVFFSAAPFGTDLALRAGLLHEVCPADRLDARVKRDRRHPRRRARAVAAAKALCLGFGDDTGRDARTSITALADCWESDEARERIRAFLGGEDRHPRRRNGSAAGSSVDDPRGARPSGGRVR